MGGEKCCFLRLQTLAEPYEWPSRGLKELRGPTRQPGKLVGACSGPLGTEDLLCTALPMFIFPAALLKEWFVAHPDPSRRYSLRYRLSSFWTQTFCRTAARLLPLGSSPSDLSPAVPPLESSCSLHSRRYAVLHILRFRIVTWLQGLAVGVFVRSCVGIDG